MDILLANTHFKEIFNLSDETDKYNLKELMAQKDHTKLEDYRLNLESNVNEFKNYEFQLINKKSEEIRDFLCNFMSS